MGENVGARVLRKEDRRFLRGKGRYTDDIRRAGELHMAIVRSPLAHAKIVSIDAGEAQQAPGVIAVLTGADFAEEGFGGLPCGWQIHSKDGSPMIEPPHPALVLDRVRHVGDQVAVVIAETRAQARAAAQLVDVDYEELSVVASISAATAEGAPLVWDEAPGNQCYDWELGDKAATAAAFEGAAHVVEIELTNNRLIPNAIEPRAAIGEYDEGTGDHTLWTTSQNPHLTRLLLSAFTMKVPEHKLRVIAPDVGGGFGSKIFHYAEELLVLWASRRVGRPVRWTAERTESFISDCHGRDHISKARLAIAEDGTFLGLHVQTRANLGAYLSTFASSVPTYLYGTLLAGPYKTPAIYVEVQAVFTNTVPVDAYRGAGRPEATYLLERLVEKAARQLGVDRVGLRRQNLIAPDQFPYQTPVALQYDIGEYEKALEMALEASRWAGFEARKAESAARGKLRGIGMSTYLEACGLAPSALAGSIGARAGLFESSTIRVNPTGSVVVFTGVHSHGQGHETAFAQIVADHFGVPFENVEVKHGDTSNSAFGMGTYGSRSLVVGGSAIIKAADKVVDKAKKIAAHMLEASVEDVEFKDGSFTVKGTDRSKAFAEVAFTAYVPHSYPEGVEPGLEETAFYDPLNFTYPAGCHVVELEVDPETGEIELLQVTAADDVGRVVNPMIVEGQLHGGLAQGIGQALLEGCVYDDTGQLLTGSYMTYTMPRAADLPMFTVGNHVTLCTHNPLGSKGVGEMGSIGVPPAVINALLDALAPLGVTHIDMPATPERVWKAIQHAKATA
ncbi:MAG: xanthine dehydrogenase family protein molybdopterin-binding subunit [Myxococcales bacterium]|nr:xanthine dehydrogenase family protein molybdopterin-binding subunit [Myxococcales bacterium]